jgi:hypothetical protein
MTEVSPPPPTIKIDKKDVEKFVEWAIKLHFIADNIRGSEKCIRRDKGRNNGFVNSTKAL